MFWFRRINEETDKYPIVGIRINSISTIGEKEYMEYVNYLDSEYAFRLGASFNISKDRVAFYHIKDHNTNGKSSHPMMPPLILGYNTNTHEFKVLTLDEFESNYIKYESHLFDELYKEEEMTKSTGCKLFKLHRKNNATVEYIGVMINCIDDLESKTAVRFFNHIYDMCNIDITYETGSEGFVCVFVEGKRIYTSNKCGFMIAKNLKCDQITTILESELSDYEMEEIEDMVGDIANNDNETLYYIKFNFIIKMIETVNLLRDVSQVIVDFNKYNPHIVEYIKRHKNIQYITDFFSKPYHYIVGEYDGVSIIFISNVDLSTDASSHDTEIMFFDSNKKVILEAQYNNYKNKLRGGYVQWNYDKQQY